MCLGCIHWACAAAVELALSTMFPGPAISVSRASITLGYSWNITFDGPTGNLPQLITDDAGYECDDVVGRCVRLSCLVVARHGTRAYWRAVLVSGCWVVDLLLYSFTVDARIHQIRLLIFELQTHLPTRPRRTVTDGIAGCFSA